uniref:Uncharacterized protein n=2 Tax=Dunaliella tertiolecta TaxID=3047 RepID=A0A7S3QTS0_DUNTE|mmetsp:Transcript_26078/g.70637  ORF Transcript_26078/g.70637 Transcript_26078/m.70637 type:complete len:1734 (-) Transcript_26078:293-5494(-)
MGGICCKEVQEYNPDGSPKPLQTKEQMKQDGPDLRKAAKNCDLEEMHGLLERMLQKHINSGAGKEEVDESEAGMAALHFSAAANHLRGATKLVLYGASIEARDARGYTPLHVQMELGLRKVAQFLINRGANLNAQDKMGATPLMLAMHHGHAAAVDLMFDASLERQKNGRSGLDLALLSKDGWSYALLLAKLGWWSDLERLLNMMKPSFEAPEARSKALSSLDVRSKSGDTLLGWVLRYVLSGCLSIEDGLSLVQRLLALGISASTPAFSENVPPLALATAIGNRELWEMISKAAGEGSERAKDGLGRSLLHYASAKGHLELVQQLSSTLRVDEADAHGNTPLHLAAMKGHATCVKELLGSAAAALAPDTAASDLSPMERVLLQPNRDGYAVLHMAMRAGPLPQSQSAALESLEKITTERLLKDARMVVNEVVKDTPLTLAVGGHQHAVVRALLDRQVDMNEQTGSQETALVRCLASVTKETASVDAAILKLLVDAGASPDTGPGNEANHPMLAICKNDCNEFARLGLEILEGKAEGGKLSWDITNPKNGRTPLMEAALHNNAYMVKAILMKENSQDMLEKVCHKGMTALCYAARGSAADAMKVLLNHRANVEHKDNEGRSVMSLCLKLDVPESLVCAALLLRAGAAPSTDVDSSGEGLLHRAVRYGAPDFIRLWSRMGGSLLEACSTPISANSVVPTSLKYDQEVTGMVAAVMEEDAETDDRVLDHDCIPVAPKEAEEADDEGLDAYGNEKVVEDGLGRVEKLPSIKASRHAQSPEADVQANLEWDGKQGDSFKGIVPQGAMAVAEGVEEAWLDGVMDGNRFGSGLLPRVPSFFVGPTTLQRRAWRRQGTGWWNGWIDQQELRPAVTKVAANTDPREEDWDIEDKDGLVTLDELMLEASDRQRSMLRREAGAICEGILGNSLVKVVPVGGEVVQSVVQANIEELGMIPDSLEDHKSELAMSLVRRLLAKKVGTEVEEVDAFYHPDKAYTGEPGCMKADLSTWDVRLASLLDSVYKRVDSYDIKPETPLQGADLRERNIRWWIKSQAPEAYPLKLGRWRSLSKLTEQAVKGARARVAPSPRLQIRKRTALIGQPDLPTCPELERTTALTYAVQLCRPACVKALLECDYRGRLLDVRDLWQHTALEYAMAMLVRDKSNVQLQQIVDMLLVRRPSFEKAISSSYHNSMHPLCLAVIAYDLPRIAWMVCCCGAPLDASWMYAPDVPCYYEGTWEKLVGSTEAIFAPLHLALMHKRVDIAKLLLDLGADSNITSWGLAGGLFVKGIFGKREEFLSELSKHRTNALKGKPDPMGEEDATAVSLRTKQLEASHSAMQKSFQAKVDAHKARLAELTKSGKEWKGKAVGQALQGLTTIVKKIMDLIKDLMGGPDPWVSALHLAARYGLADLCVLLLDRGATVCGGVAAATARRTPLEEALKYARSNFRLDNCDAVRHNWVAIERKAESMIPPMSPAALAAEAQSKAKKLQSMMNPVVAGVKVGIMAAKVVITVLLESFKRPIAHYDNAMKAAHVLVRHHCILRPYDSQTNILLRDLADNGTWAWVGGDIAEISDAQWLKKVDKTLEKLADTCNLRKAGGTDDPKEYKDIVKAFKQKMNSKYFTHSFEDFQGAHQKELKKKVYDLELKMQVFKAQVLERAHLFHLDACLARSQLVEKGLKWEQRVKEELVQARQKAETDPPMFQEPFASSTLQMAEFDIQDPVKFLGGGLCKATILSCPLAL